MMMDSDVSSINENTVKYSIYPILSSSESIKDELVDRINEFYGKLAVSLASYLWQNMPFQLFPIVDTPCDDLPHCGGLTTFDDNVEDEWFIVYLLLKLSEMDESLVIKVEDYDGEFLLIEAATELPNWVNPETSLNRVYIFKGEVHLIPIDVEGVAKSNLKISDAIEFIRKNSKLTRASDAIQKCTQNRISSFIKGPIQLKQKVKCFIPAAVVALIEHEPNLISQAVRAFYYRDQVDIRACKVMKNFPPENRVMRNIALSRCMYAQLISQKYTPEKCIGWNIPAANSPDFKACDLGMKIACGFEMILASSNQLYSQSPTEEENDVFKTKEWTLFLNSLEKNGYFRDLLKGSKAYNELLRDAQSFFTNLSLQEKLYNNSDLINNSRLVIAAKILNLLETIDVDYDKYKNEESHIELEDDDDWLTLKPDELEALLKEKFNVKDEKQLSENLANEIPKVIQDFVNYEKSGFDGAEVPPEFNKESKAKVRASTDKKVSKGVEFNVDEIGNALSSILSLKIPQSDSDDSSSSGLSEYNSANDSLDSDDDDIQILYQGAKIRQDNRKEESEKIETETDTSHFDIGEMKDYMNQMDNELSKTNVGQSFERKAVPPLAVPEELDDFDDDECRPIDVDLTALKNILESVSSQEGLPGPASNILASMGLHLPPNCDGN